MAGARATWKGVLKISLVTIPIKVFPATESAGSISFNQLHSECQTRMQQKRWCPKCKREVANADIVKGFEFEKDRYVILNEDELDAVQPPSTKVIDLTTFAPAEQLDPRAVDRAYFLAADGPVDGPADEAYRTLQAAMTGRLGIGKVALYNREYLVAVGPRNGVLVLYTLHHAAELRAAPDVTSSDRYMRGVSGARQLLVAMTRPLNLAAFTDEYQMDLRRLIDAKIAGQEIVVSQPIETPAVLNLKAALEQSLEAVRATKKRPAKAVLEQAPAPVVDTAADRGRAKRKRA